MENEYKPKPVDTSDVFVDEKILVISEQLAKNTHEVWAEGKLKEGWRYGKKLDADKKEHPSLIPYEELSEAQKDYDRHTAMETIKVLIKLGFSVKGDNK